MDRVTNDKTHKRDNWRAPCRNEDVILEPSHAQGFYRHPKIQQERREVLDYPGSDRPVAGCRAPQDINIPMAPLLFPLSRPE